MDRATTGKSGLTPNSIGILTESDVEEVACIGARLAVLCKFVDAVLPELTAEQCLQVEQFFRQGVEHAMSLTDDMDLPAVYHSTLLEQTNLLLNVLGKKGVTQC